MVRHGGPHLDDGALKARSARVRSGCAEFDRAVHLATDSFNVELGALGAVGCSAEQRGNGACRTGCVFWRSRGLIGPWWDPSGNFLPPISDALACANKQSAGANFRRVRPLSDRSAIRLGLRFARGWGWQATWWG